MDGGPFPAKLGPPITKLIEVQNCLHRISGRAELSASVLPLERMSATGLLGPEKSALGLGVRGVSVELCPNRISDLACRKFSATNSMSKIDPHDRIDLTGPWAGFGFQAGHMFTPEGHQLEPCDMTWWSLTCNIAREWRLMMAEAAPRRPAARKASATAKSSAIYLAESLRIRRERRFGVRDPDFDAATSNVGYMSRGPKSRQRK